MMKKGISKLIQPEMASTQYKITIDIGENPVLWVKGKKSMLGGEKSMSDGFFSPLCV